MAEASRQTMGWRFATMHDREAVVAMIADAAEQASLRLTPPDLATSPAAFRRVDGTSVFRPKHSTVFSSELLLAAEDRLLDRSQTMTAPTVPLATIEKITTKPDRDGRILGEDQADALTKIAVSGRLLDAIRRRRNLKWGIPAMLLAVPYLLIASICTNALADGAPGWLHLVVLWAVWNALKFIIMGPVSLILLIRARTLEAIARHRNRQATRDSSQSQAPMTAGAVR